MIIDGYGSVTTVTKYGLQNQWKDSRKKRYINCLKRTQDSLGVLVGVTSQKLVTYNE